MLLLLVSAARAGNSDNKRTIMGIPSQHGVELAAAEIVQELAPIGKYLRPQHMKLREQLFGQR